MAHFAEIDENNVVKRVLVIEQNVVDTGNFGDPKNFIQTSYNTHGNVHALGGPPLRKNYAGKGYFYDKDRDAFIPPKPFESWTLNEETCLWEPPIPYPNDEKSYMWNEKNKNWIEKI